MNTIESRQTEHLLLTRLRARDFEDLHIMHSNAQVMATLGGVRSRAETLRVLTALVADWEQHGFGYWLARDRVRGTFAARGGLRRVVLEGQPQVEVGYAVMPEFWGRGLATEIARESIGVAFDELGLRELVCFTLPTNRASQRVMQKAGFRYAGETMWADQPHVLYRLSARESQ